VGAPSGVDGNGPKRFSVQRKMAIVARLLRGEPLELVARETNFTSARVRSLLVALASLYSGGTIVAAPRQPMTRPFRGHLAAPLVDHEPLDLADFLALGVVNGRCLRPCRSW
jgi:hypothetical protein